MLSKANINNLSRLMTKAKKTLADILFLKDCKAISKTKHLMNADDIGNIESNLFKYAL